LMPRSRALAAEVASNACLKEFGAMRKFIW
jgi:hypothetical protein